MPSLESDFCAAEKAGSAGSEAVSGGAHGPKQLLTGSPAPKALAYPDLLATGGVHVGEGGAQGRSAVVTAEFGPKPTRLSPAACSASIGVSRGRVLVIGGVEEREWFGARHVGQVGGLRQRCFDVVCSARGSRGSVEGAARDLSLRETPVVCGSVVDQEGDLVGGGGEQTGGRKKSWGVESRVPRNRGSSGRWTMVDGRRCRARQGRRDGWIKICGW